MICSFKPFNYNLKKKEKGTTQFVVSASYLNKDQQRIQENNARTKKDVTVQKLFDCIFNITPKIAGNYYLNRHLSTK